jgi:multiple sugar transport system permease protein
MSQADGITLGKPSTQSSAIRYNRTLYRVRRVLGQVFIWLFIGAGLVIMVVPALWLISSSLKTLAEVFAVPMRLLPQQPQWQNYIDAIETTHMGRSFRNSSILAVTSTVLAVFISTWGGYVFSKLEWRGREQVMTALLSTMMIPGFLTLIPKFVMVIKLGMMNSFAGVIVPGLVSTFGIFMCRQFMLSIPKDLTDAAIVDGCNVFGIYWRIILPLCKPVMAVLAISTFTGSWNNLLWPLMILTDQRLHTIPVTLAGLRTQEMFQYHIQMAGASIAVIPVIIIFLIFQRYIIEGVALTGIKG